MFSTECQKEPEYEFCGTFLRDVLCALFFMKFNGDMTELGADFLDPEAAIGRGQGLFAPNVITW
jgi:hypothetical protein